MQTILTLFNSAAMAIVPFLLFVDIYLTMIINVNHRDIDSKYFKLSLKFGILKSSAVKVAYVFLVLWRAGQKPYISIGTPITAFQLVYIAVVIIYVVEFARHKWRLKHNVPPTVASSNNKESGSTTSNHISGSNK